MIIALKIMGLFAAYTAVCALIMKSGILITPWDRGE